MNFCLLNCGQIIILILFSSTLVNGQSRCNTICDQDRDCKSGKCILSECTDTELCFEFCFTCDGQKTCFASGSKCDYRDNLVYLGSNSIKYSNKLLGFCLLMVPIIIYRFF
jgi:hypothetical protein